MRSIKLNFTAMAFLLGSVIAVTQSSFTASKSTEANFAGTNYVFNGHTLAADKIAANYSVSTSNPGCDEVPTLPCVINVPTGTTLSAWLAARTSSQIMTDATNRKSN
jgi:hypothetical protein